MSKQESCEQRIAGQMAARFEDITNAMAAYEENDYDEDATAADGETSLSSLRDSLLEVRPRITVRLLLSTGGPADGFDVVVEDGELVSGTYFFQDWFDGATRPLSTEELAAVEQVYGPFDHLRLAD